MVKTKAPVLWIALIAVVVVIVGGFYATASGAPNGPIGKNDVRAEAAGVNEGTKKQATAVRMRPADAAPDAVAGDFGKFGGCVPGYGKGKACLPPAAQTSAWTCAEVRAVLPKGIAVNKKDDDALKLDKNSDGTACGVGD